MTLTGPMKCILALVTVAVIAVGFWMLDWQPRLRQCDDLRVEAVQKQQDYRAICEQLRGLTALIHENETLKARLDGLVRGHLAGRETVDRALATMLVRLESTTTDARTPLTITALTPGAAKEAPAAASTPAAGVLARFPSRQFNLQMSGRFDAVLGFLDAVSNLALEHLVTVDSLTLTATGDRNSRLSITLPITAYLKTGGP